MIDRLIEFSLRQRGLVVLAAVALVAFGLWSAWRLPIDAVPDITNTQVQINTEVGGLSPEEIEQLVTFPIETEMTGLPGLTELRSLSKFGLSQVTLVFRDGTDLDRARQRVAERLQNARDALPSGLTPKLAPVTTGLGEIYYYVLDYRPGREPPGLDRRAQLMELKLLHDYVVKPQLRSVPGVAEVNASGGYEKQIVVTAEPGKLLAAGLTFEDLAAVLAENVENTGGGAVQLGGEQISIRADGRVRTAEEIAALPVKFNAGAAPLRVADVAAVAVGTNLRSGSATHNGREAVLGAALMLTGGNSRIVARAVEEKLRALASLLPPEVEIITVYNRTDLVDRTIRTVERNLAEGALLVIAVLFALLGNWRAALIVSLAIPLSFLCAIIGMERFGISGNLMSLGAVDFGLIIDGAVVMIENVVRHLAEKQAQLGRPLTRAERGREVLASALQVGRPMFFGVLIVTVVYVPILALTGIEGKMFKPMALTVMFALGGALVLALTLMPVLCALFLGGRIRERESLLVRGCKFLYAPLLQWALRWRWLFVGAAAAAFAGSLVLLSRLGAEFIPQLDEGSYATHLMRTTSIGLDASIAMQERSEKALRELFPEVTHVFSRIGTAEVATDPMGVNVSDTYIFYQPRSAWREIDGRRPTKDELANRMSAELAVRVPGQAYLFSQPIEMRFNEILEGTRADLAVKVFGEDFAEIERLAIAVREVLESIPGAADVEFDALGKAPLLEIRPDRAALLRYNLHAAEINRAVAHGLAGEEVGFIVEGNRRYPIAVRMADDLRHQLDLLRRIPVRTVDGGLLTLGQVAKFEIVEQVNAIARELGRRRAAIMVNLRGRDTESFVREAQARIAAEVPLPPGYTVEFGGQFKNLLEARQRLTLVVPVALAFIFVLLVFSFGSLRQAALVFVCVPMAVTGAVCSLWLRGLPFTISAGIGFIALSGIATLNGVMLISYINQLRAEGRALRAAVVEGALTRLRPKLMTALVAALGFLPMALATGAGAEVQRPLATVVIGGIVSSTFLTLLILPALYLWAESRGASASPPNLDPNPTPP